MDLPIPRQVVEFLGVSKQECGGKAHKTCLTRGTIVQKNAVLPGIDEAAHVHLPGVLRERVRLYMAHAQIASEVNHEDIGRSCLRFRSTSRIATRHCGSRRSEERRVGEERRSRRA